MQKAGENDRIKTELKFFGKTVKGLSREEFEEALYRALAGEYTREEQSRPQSVVWSIPEAEFDELYRKAQNEELKTAEAWEAELARLRKRYGIPEPRPEEIPETETEGPETEETPPLEGPEEEETPPESNREHETEGTRFEDGTLYEASIEVNGIVVEAMAEIEIVGKSLRFNNITIYSQQGDVPNQVGIKALLKWYRSIKKAAVSQGFEELQIHGQRAAHSTSATPGMMIDQIISLK